MQGLKDIKPLVEVPDHSLLVLLLIMIALVALGIGLYLWYKKPRRRRRKKPTARELAQEQLKTLDFTDTKKAVYDFSEAMHLLIPDEKKETLQALLKKLEIYKYKKSIPTLSDEDKNAMQAMIKELGNV